MPGTGAHVSTTPAAAAVSVETVFAKPTKRSPVTMPSASTIGTTAPATEPSAVVHFAGVPIAIVAAAPEATTYWVAQLFCWLLSIVKTELGIPAIFVKVKVNNLHERKISRFFQQSFDEPPIFSLL